MLEWPLFAVPVLVTAVKPAEMLRVNLGLGCLFWLTESLELQWGSSESPRYNPDGILTGLNSSEVFVVLLPGDLGESPF